MGSAKYVDIYNSLREHIRQGDYSTTGLLPSEWTLIEEYNCSRNTVRRAISMLIEDGLVQAIHGKGVQLLSGSEKLPFKLGGIESFGEAAARVGKSPSTQVLSFEEATISEQEAAETGFEPGCSVVRIHRIRFLDGVPDILDINYFLASEVPGLTAEIASDSIYSFLENKLGMQITTSLRRISAQEATQEDMDCLHLRRLNFVCVITSQTFNSKGIQFEYTQSRHRPDTFSFHETAVRQRH